MILIAMINWNVIITDKRVVVIINVIIIITLIIVYDNLIVKIDIQSKQTRQEELEQLV